MRAGLFLDYVDPWINWDWLSTHIPLVLDALTEHVELTVIAIAAGLAISVPVGVLAHRNAPLRLAVLGFFGAFSRGFFDCVSCFADRATAYLPF